MTKMKLLLILLTALLGTTSYAQDSLPSLRHSFSGKDLADSLATHNYNQLTTTLPLVIDESQMNNLNQVTNVFEAIRGRVAGLQVTGNGNNALSAVRLRGTTSLTGGNDPLIIVDGVMGDLTILQSIYPTDIESFTILKDASETAQYGSRGAAGVIDIKTKRGKSGKLRIFYNGAVGVSKPFKRLEMLSADGYRAVAEQYNIPIIDKGYDTDFQKAIERTAITHQHHVAFAGGGDNGNYRVSLGNIDEQEVIKGIGNRSFIASMNMSQTMWDGVVRIDLGIFASTQESEKIYDEQKLFYSAAAFNPTFPDHLNSMGTWDAYPSASQIKNPNELLNQQNHTTGNHISTHTKLTFRLLPELRLVLFGAYTYDFEELMRYLPVAVGNESKRSTTRDKQGLANITVKLNKKWGSHALSAALSSELQQNKRQRYEVTVKNFSNDIGGYDALSSGALRPWDGTSSYYEHPTMASFMGQASYTFNDRYSVKTTLRADGSSKFGNNNKWGYFPSVSVGWDLGKEPFIRNLRFLNDLKLNAGLGWAGNQGAIDSYNTAVLLEANGTPSVGQSLITTYAELKNNNPDLKWEVSRTFNIGITTQLFNQRLLFSANYYYTYIYDMLYPYTVSVPPFKYPKLLANMGSMEKSGLELSLGATPLVTHDMQLTINANLTFQRNKLLSLSGSYKGEYLSEPGKRGIAAMNGAGFHGGNSLVFQMIGEPLGVFYLPRFVDFHIYEEYQNLQAYNVGGSYVAGQATPKVLLGSNISFRYKRFDIAVQANGAFGHKIYNGTSLSYMNLSNLPYYNVLADAPEKKYVSQEVSDYWLENGNYVNIDYITLGWQVPVPQNRILESARLSLTLNNVATFTSYSGLTPMINSTSINNTLGIDDKRTYPLFRTWTASLSLNF